MRSFTLVQNLLTALVVPFLALIVGLSSLPGIYILFKIMDFFGTSASTFNQIDSVPLEDFVVVGIGLKGSHMRTRRESHHSFQSRSKKEEGHALP